MIVVSLAFTLGQVEYLEAGLNLLCRIVVAHHVEIKFRAIKTHE